MSNNYYNKYLKYKQKYQQLKNNKKGGAIFHKSEYVPGQVEGKKNILKSGTLSDIYVPLIYYALDPGSVTSSFLNRDAMNSLLIPLIKNFTDICLDISFISFTTGVDTPFDKLISYIRFNLNSLGIFNIKSLTFDSDNHPTQAQQESILYQAFNSDMVLTELCRVIRENYSGDPVYFTAPDVSHQSLSTSDDNIWLYNMLIKGDDNNGNVKEKLHAYVQEAGTYVISQNCKHAEAIIEIIHQGLISKINDILDNIKKFYGEEVMGSCELPNILKQIIEEYELELNELLKSIMFIDKRESARDLTLSIRYL